MERNTNVLPPTSMEPTFSLFICQCLVRLLVLPQNPDPNLKPHSAMFTEPPEPPSSLYLAEVRSRSIALSWYPAFKGNSPVLHYVVKYKEKNAPWRYERNVTVVAGLSSAVLENLSPNTEYQMRVVSVNSVGVGPPSEVMTAITEEEGRSSIDVGVIRHK